MQRGKHSAIYKKGGIMKIKHLYAIAEDERGEDYLIPITALDVLRIVRAHVHGNFKKHKVGSASKVKRG
jgi:hypothetical protein